jgi:hypothetical protein
MTASSPLPLAIMTVVIKISSSDIVPEFIAPAASVPALKMHKITAGFAQNQPKMRKLTNFNRNHSKSPVSSRFKGTDSMGSPSILPTKHPCDLSALFFSKFLLSHFSYSPPLLTVSLLPFEFFFTMIFDY